MLLRAEIDLHSLDPDALLGEENADPARTWRAAAVVKLHVSLRPVIAAAHAWDSDLLTIKIMLRLSLILRNTRHFGATVLE
jgi:hypothetical protein